MNDLYTVAVITGAVVAGFVCASLVVFGAIVMLRHRRQGAARRIIAGTLLLYSVVNLWGEATAPLPGDIGPMIGRMNTASTHNRHPLPCIRRYEGTYSDHSGRYVGAYQFMRSTHASVSNARQERAWPRLSSTEQDRAAWRLYELRGLSRWSDKVRRNCR